MKKTLASFIVLALLAAGCAVPGAGDAGTRSAAGGAAVTAYPLNYCLVSGDKIGEMGEPVAISYEGQEIKFCCKDCVKEFQKDPKKYVEKLAEARRSGALVK